MSTEACNLLRPLLYSILLPAGASLSQPIPIKARAACRNNRGLYRVNEYRPRNHASSTIRSSIQVQPQSRTNTSLTREFKNLSGGQRPIVDASIVYQTFKRIHRSIVRGPPV